MKSCLSHLRGALCRGAASALIAAWALVAVPLTMPSLAEAADPARAKKLVGEARNAVKANQLDRAIAKLREAATHLDHPSIHFAQSRVLTRMLDLNAAMAALDKCEEFELPRKLKQAVAKQRAVIAQSKLKLGQLVLKTTPKSAAVMITEGPKKLSLQAPVDRFFQPNKITIDIAAPGYRAMKRSAQLEAGQVVRLELALERMLGKVRVSVAGGLKGVQLIVDGKPMEVAAAEAVGDVTTISLAPGAHEVVCARGEKRESKVFKVTVDQTISVACAGLARQAGTKRAAVGWGVVAAGALLAGLGGYHINGYFNDVTYAENNGLIASKDRAFGGTAFVVGGVAMGVTSYLLWLRNPAAASTAMSRPWPSERLDGTIQDASAQRFPSF